MDNEVSRTLMTIISLAVKILLMVVSLVLGLIAGIFGAKI